METWKKQKERAKEDLEREKKKSEEKGCVGVKQWASMHRL